MKKEYIIPELEVIEIKVGDIVRTSGEDDLPMVPMSF